MATNYNYFGNLVTNGLVLDLDAAKLASYPGSGTAWRDISGNGNNGTLTNGPTFSGVGKQAAIVFDGVDDFVTMSLSVAQGQGNQTYSHWIKITSSISSDKLIFFEETAGTSNYTRIGCTITSGSYFQFGGRGTSNEPLGNGYFKKSSSPILPNLWTNVIGLWDVTNSTIKLYINGSEVSGSFSGAGSVQTHANTPPGTVRIGSSRTSEYFLGSIANTQIYNKILSPFEVWQNFNALKGRYGIPDIVTNGLVLNLDAGNPYSYLSGSSGTTWTNTVAVSSSISGTLVNGTTYANGAMVFDGVDDYAIGNGVFVTTEATLIVWFKTSNTYGNNYLLSLPWVSSNNNGFDLGFGGSTTFRGIVVTTSGFKELNYTTTYSDNNWHMAAMTYSASNAVLYYDGIARTTDTTLSGSLRQTTNGEFNIARFGSFGAHVAANISSAQIYNRALSAAEIQQNFNALRGRYGI